MHRNFKTTIFQFVANTGYAVVALFFLYHGAVALTLDEGFLQAFTLVNITPPASHIFMILIGVVDILVGLSLAFWRNKLALLWAFVWPFVPATTGALLHPNDLMHVLGEHVALSVGVLALVILFPKYRYNKVFRILKQAFSRWFMKNNR